MPTVENAVQYAEMGYAIFPVWGITANGVCQCGKADCDNAGKHPITNRGVLDATSNIRQVRIWWAKYPDANIAIATGEASGVVVLDIDGPEGLKSLSEFPSLPKTPSVATGKGVHYYFNHPGFKVKNSANRVAPKIDIRGDGGYVIAPPSKHVSGNVYTWSEDVVDAELADIPDWLLAKLNEAGKPFGENDESATIELGGRNIFLTKKAGTLRRAGFGIGAIRAALIEHNAQKCRPPLPEDEVEKIVQSIGTKDYDPKEDTVGVTVQDNTLGDRLPTPECRTAPHTDVGNAEAFTSLYGDSFRYDHTRKKWMVWLEDSGVWREDFANLAHRALIKTIRARGAIAATITDDAERQALQKWAMNSEKGKAIPFALGHAATFPGIAVKSTDFDTRPEMLNFLNGVLNLDTLHFREAVQGDMISRQMATVFDATAKAPIWEATVNQIFDGDEELIAYVQRAMGYCLSGKTNEQAFFIGHGSGANGKSTILNTTRKLMGDYGSTTAFATFDADNRNQYGNDLAALKGRRFVIAIEAEQSKRLAEARVKTVTGGEPVSCRFLYGEFFEMVPEFKVWLAVNHKPIIRGADHGIWRRIHLIPFEVTFGSPEEIESGRAKYLMDRELDEKLAAEWPGIANWLIQGYLNWREQGLNPPASVKAATQEYKRENDNVALWLDERCETGTGDGYFMPATEGYDDFRTYLQKAGEIERAIPSMRVWGTLMTEKGFQKKRTNKGYEYVGVKVQPVKLNENRGN